MITLSAIWIRYGFLVLAALLLLVAVLQLVNSMRHGSRMPANILVTLVFVLGIVAIVVITNSLLINVDWNATYTLTLPSASLLRFGL